MEVIQGQLLPKYLNVIMVDEHGPEGSEVLILLLYQIPNPLTLTP